MQIYVTTLENKKNLKIRVVNNKCPLLRYQFRKYNRGDRP